MTLASLLSQSSQFVSWLFMRLWDTLLGMTWVFTFYRTKALTGHECRTGHMNNVTKPLYLFLTFKGCTLCKEIWKFSSIPIQEVINLSPEQFDLTWWWDLCLSLNTISCSGLDAYKATGAEIWISPAHFRGWCLSINSGFLFSEENRTNYDFEVSMDKTRVLLCICVPKTIAVYSNRERGWGRKERRILLLYVPTETF